MKIITGKVLHKKLQKTARVTVERLVADPVYGKRIRFKKHYLVHDEMGASVGQTVKFVASKPYSKLKKWKIIEIVGAGKKVKEKKVNAKPKQATKKIKK